MANRERLSTGAVIVVGLVFGAVGTGLILVALGVFGGGWTFGATPAWVGVCFGLVFVLGGPAVIVGYGVAGGADDRLPGTPFAVHLVQHLLGLGIVVAMASFVTWAALGSGTRRSGAAAVGAAVLWVFVAVMVVVSARRLRRR